MSTLMVFRCPRCGKITAGEYDDRYVFVCVFCIESGKLIHLRLIPKVMIDPEEPATTIDQYLTWEEYNERLESKQGAEATGNISTAEE